MDLHGPVGILDLFSVFVSLVSSLFGLLVLIADVVAISYIFSATSPISAALARQGYRFTLWGLVLANVLMILVGGGLWRDAMLGPRIVSDKIENLNVISPIGLLVFFAAPWLRSWRLSRGPRVSQ